MDLERKCPGVLWGKSRRLCRNWILIFKRNFRVEKIFLCKKYYLLLSLENRAENVRLTVGKSQRGSQAAFYFSIGTIWRKKIWKVFAFFVDFFGSIPVSEQGKFGRPVKTAFSVSIETFFEKKTILGNKENFYHFQDTEQKFLASCLLF